MIRALLGVLLATVAGCTCARSHGVGRDAGVADRDAEVDAAPPGADAGIPPCGARCRIDLVARGYAGPPPFADETYTGEGWNGRVEWIAAAPSPGGGAYLLARALGTYRYGPWALLDTDLTGGVTRAAEPWSPYGRAGAPLDERVPGRTIGALLLAGPTSVDAIIAFTERVREPERWSAKVAHVRWSSERRVTRGEVLGELLVRPRFHEDAQAAVFGLPGGHVVAAVSDGGRIVASRITVTPEGEAEMGPAVALDTGRMTEEGGSALAGAAITDEVWAFAGGGRVEFDTRPAFATVTSGAESIWTEPVPGVSEDGAPLLAATSPPALFRFRQAPDDLEDTWIVSARLGEAGLSDERRVAARGLPLPLAAHVGPRGGGAFAVWSARSPDVLSDTTVQLVLLGGEADGCGATPVIPVAYLPGAAAAPTVHGLEVGGELVLFGLPLGEDGLHAPVAFRARCDLTPP